MTRTLLVGVYFLICSFALGQTKASKQFDMFYVAVGSSTYARSTSPRLHGFGSCLRRQRVPERSQPFCSRVERTSASRLWAKRNPCAWQISKER